MTHTEFWLRMDDALGPAYARTWGAQFALGDLDSRTAREALDAGVDPRLVWAAVWRALELPANKQ